MTDAKLRYSPLRARVETVRSSYPGARAGLLAMALALSGCASGDTARHGDEAGTSEGTIPSEQPFAANTSFFQANTISRRVGLPLAGRGALLNATALAKQLTGYDPGSLLRCELAEQAAYDAAVDALGGVSWGYGVSALEDQSKPRFLAGFQNQAVSVGAPTAANDASPAPAVEIALPDIVAVTESAALFYSQAHGLLLVDLTGEQPRFQCATQLPGRVDEFFFRAGHLVAMTKAHGSGGAALLHFEVTGTQLRFIEKVDLGRVNILDSRRFNDKLVFYTDLPWNDSPPVAQGPQLGGGINGGVQAPPVNVRPQPQDRALRVFRLGDRLVEEMSDTLIDTTQPEEQLASDGVTPDTAVGTLLHESHRFGQGMWASDHYFVVTDETSKTYLSGWRSSTYPVCTQSHTVQSAYDYCWTEYETRPNPDYAPPDNSGGDRSCQGTTLSDCLVRVARVSNQTIQLPVARRCEERTRQTWVCDAHEQRTTQYPEFRSEQSSRLFIYEYTDTGFVRLDGSVHEITTGGLQAQSPEARISTLTTSTDTFDLAVPGAIQTLYFQGGFLYVISQGILQVYAMGGSSIVRTSTLPVVNESLQATLFSGSRLYLSDFGWSRGDHSTLRVVNLDNPAFPTVEASTHSLPGGHRSILASDFGIFTIGAVQRFQGQTLNAIKLGLFSDPFVDERAYLLLATDLAGASLAAEEAQFFNSAEQRLLLPYVGRNEQNRSVARVGVSHIAAEQIVSEGAVILPEPAQRVRPLGGATEGYLSFATSSIEWLTPQAQAWQTTPVLEYFQPSAVYRLNEQDDYAEVQRLGDRCKLFFANASEINQRDAGNDSEEFDCFGGGATAYGTFLLFAETGLEFDAQAHSIRMLSADEIAATRTKIAQRPVCLLSLELVDNVNVNLSALPNDAQLTCMSPSEYQERLSALLNARRGT
jgi:hypothetical protein